MQRTTDPTRPVAWRRRVGAALLVGALVLAACGDDDDAASTDDTSIDDNADRDVRRPIVCTGRRHDRRDARAGFHGVDGAERYRRRS